MPCMSSRFSFSYCQAVSIWVIGQDQIDAWHFVSFLKRQLQGTLALFLGADFLNVDASFLQILLALLEVRPSF